MATARFLEAAELAKKEGNKRVEAEAYYELAIAYRSSNPHKEIEYFIKYLEIAKERQDKYQEATALNCLGDAYLRTNQFETAIEYFLKCLEIAKEQPDKYLEAQAFWGLGEAYRVKGQFETAIEYYLKCLEIAKERQDKYWEARAFCGLGEAYRFKGQFETAIEYYLKCLEIAKERDKYLEAQAFCGLGDAYRGKGQFEMAIEYYLKCLEIAKKQQDKYNEGRAFHGLGDVYRVKDQFETAIEYYLKCLEIAKEQQDKYLEAHAFCGLGDAYRGKGQFETAIEYYLKCLEIAKERKDKYWEAHAFCGLGEVYQGKRQLEKAFECFLKSLKNAKEQQDEDVEEVALRGLGELYELSSQSELASKYFEKYLEIAKKEDVMQSEVLMLLGKIEVSKKNTFAKSDAEELLVQKQPTLDKNSTNAASLADKELDTSSNERKRVLKRDDLEDEQFPPKKSRFLLSLNKTDAKEILVREESKLVEDLTDRDTVACTDAGELLVEKQPTLDKNPTNTASVAEEELVGDQSKSLGDSKNRDTAAASTVSLKEWRWTKRSKVYREKLEMLCRYQQTKPEKVLEINGVSVCFSPEFCIGNGSDGTQVYVGLGNDGQERAVKRLMKYNSEMLAEQEKKSLINPNAKKSNHVVNYWYLEKERSEDFIYLILDDLCEETLKDYVNRESLEDLIKIAPKIIYQILTGLSDLHREPTRILHRDLKPSNILRNVDDEWLLADFGTSRSLEEDEQTHRTKEAGTHCWRAVETYPSEDMTEDNNNKDNASVRYKEESDIQVVGMLLYYIVTKGKFLFGADHRHNLLHDKPNDLKNLTNDVLEDFILWMVSHEPENRPSAKEALKHPYLQTAEQNFEMLCEMGNQPEIKTSDNNSNVVQQLDSDLTDWRNLIGPDVFTYLSADPLGRRTFTYGPSWSQCLRLIRNVKQHWKDVSRPLPQPEAFYIVGNPKDYFLTVFPNLPVMVHRIVRSCDWKERQNLEKYFT